MTNSLAAYNNLTGKQLEMARAYFQATKNSRKVHEINEVLRIQLLSRISRG